MDQVHIDKKPTQNKCFSDDMNSDRFRVQLCVDLHLDEINFVNWNFGKILYESEFH